MRKQITAFLILVLIFVVVAIPLFFPSEPKFETLEERADFPFWVFYNGTRYFLKEVNPVSVVEEESIFSLNIDIQLTGYSRDIILFQENSNLSSVEEVENKGEKNGTYKIRDFYIEPQGDNKKYPYDEYTCNLTFESVNESYPKIFNYYQKAAV